MKVKYLSYFSLLGLLAACDPAVDEYDPNGFYTENELASSVEITQPYADYPDVLRFTTNPAKSIQILDENGNLVASGTACDSFKVAPGIAGNFTIKCLSQDGEVITTTKTINISKYTNVPKSWYYITGNKEGEFSGSAEWVWDELSNGACWGNGGYLTGGPYAPNNFGGKWWGAKISEFSGQLGHAVGGVLTGEESADAKMVISGASISKYAGDGTLLASGSFSIKDVADDANKVAEFKTTNNTVLWPYQINGGGVYVNSFEVTYIDENYLQLVYAKPGTRAWSECTWWEFKRKGADAYVNPSDYQVWVNDKYVIADASGNVDADADTVAVKDGKLTFSYISLKQPFIFKAQTITSDNQLTVPEDTKFVDITPANASIYEVVGKDTSDAIAQNGDAFDALSANAKYNVTITYNEDDKKYSIYYSEYDVDASSILLIARANTDIFLDKDKKAVNDSNYIGVKTVSGSITTYTFKDVTFKEGGNEFFFSNLMDDPYYIVFQYDDITLLKGDDEIFEAGSTIEGKNLIKLASTIKEPVTIVVSVYQNKVGGNTVYLSASGKEE